MEIKKITGNVGEWSEFYALVKLLADGKVYGADENLESLQNTFYPILKILRSEAKKPEITYSVNPEIQKVDIYDKYGNLISSLSQEFLKNKSLQILNSIKLHSKGSFTVENAKYIMQELRCSTIKAGSLNKADINLVIHDLHVGTSQNVGFSIKSKLGSPSTLFNSSDHTRFVYEVKGLTIDQAQEANLINTKGKVLDRVKYIYLNGGRLEYSAIESAVFKRNLRIIDSAMDKIVAEVLKAGYINNEKKLSKIVQTEEFLKPLEIFDLTPKDYEFKVKNLLWSSALGMTPGKPWGGYDTVYGGYLIVKENGEIVCYHVYNQDQFKDYLLKSTYLESPSTSRHKYGKLIFENGKIYFKLSLQIRFK